ncbi:TSUP family transporter [Meridianimarinicoccus sp. RP-17]|uniref:TSUP family transporter n=1 Tax=Meridianimarinicoccus zhengii TaxID=2056810 RepID=UPI0013A6EC2B|nr:TSUP family transporter [Phycocomes zhengii]
MTAELLPPIGALAANAILAGLPAALLGAGGGIVPVLLWILPVVDFPPEITMHMAVGTAAAFGFVIAGWGVPGRPPLSLGYVDLAAAAVILPFCTAAAAHGARLANWVNPIWIRRVLEVFLFITAIRMLASVWT